MNFAFLPMKFLTVALFVLTVELNFDSFAAVENDISRLSQRFDSHFGSCLLKTILSPT